ncbi:MAG: carboxypeptidase-like regulatory domain-containing protein, partial [Muribaculaceae bacterium]|nr:carboxypeptidase-like regulatory domain-containing protein [Muribaculaceae bacterium]
MRKTILTILFGVSAGAALYASVITGKVRDTEKEPLPGATVKLSSIPDSITPRYVITDINGDFRFNEVSPGAYMLAVSMIGMDSIERKVNIMEQDSLLNLGEITMGEAAIALK